jgi:DNA-binding NtrC family response regulator
MSSQTKSVGRVLVVEDDRLYSGLACEYLRGKGVEPTVASDRNMALVEIEKQSPHMVLLDVNLSGENGLTLIPWFKKMCPSAPIVILTGAGYDDAMIKDAIQMGASAFFSKENELEGLVDLLHQIMLERN